jgi:hypothetical protein
MQSNPQATSELVAGLFVLGSLAFWLVVWVGLGIFIAKQRGTDWSMAVMWTVLLGPIGIIAVLLDRSGLKTCPACTRDIPKAARRCPYCRSAV